jgi:hypothetical protein
MARGSQNGVGNNPTGFSSNQRKIWKRFYRDAYLAWDKKGPAALDAMAKKNPTAFCQMFASMMPKHFDFTQEVNVNQRKTVDIRLVVEELAQITDRLGLGEIKELPHTRLIEHEEVKDK